MILLNETYQWAMAYENSKLLPDFLAEKSSKIIYLVARPRQTPPGQRFAVGACAQTGAGILAAEVRGPGDLENPGEL